VYIELSLNYNWERTFSQFKHCPIGSKSGDYINFDEILSNQKIKINKIKKHKIHPMVDENVHDDVKEVVAAALVRRCYPFECMSWDAVTKPLVSIELGVGRVVITELKKAINEIRLEKRCGRSKGG